MNNRIKKMVEHMSESSDEETSDEEFDLEALRRARPFLSDDEANEYPESTENDGKNVVLELTPIASMTASIVNTPNYPTCHAKEEDDIYGEKTKSDQRKAKFSDTYLSNRLSAYRKRVLTRANSQSTGDEGEHDNAAGYMKRLQEIRQRILTLRNANENRSALMDNSRTSILDNNLTSILDTSHNSMLESSRTSILDIAALSMPTTSRQPLTPRTSPVLTRRTHAHIDISIPTWVRQNDVVLPFDRSEEPRDRDRDERSNMTPFLPCRSLGSHSDDSEDDNSSRYL